VKNAKIVVIVSCLREAIAYSQVSFPPGGRTISTCGAPCGSPACGPMAGVTTLTGVSSAPSAGSAASAAFIASPNPAPCSRWSSRVLALSTQPGDTRIPVSMPIRAAVRSAGTFPYPASSSAAAFSPGP
jgi:hypothetical protein